jgi:hypothetical protein
MKMHKLTSLLPTWRRGLDRCSLGAVLWQGMLSGGGSEGVNEPVLEGEEGEPNINGQPIGWGLFSLSGFEFHAATRTSYVALQLP